MCSTFRAFDLLFKRLLLKLCSACGHVILSDKINQEVTERPKSTLFSSQQNSHLFLLLLPSRHTKHLQTFTTKQHLAPPPEDPLCVFVAFQTRWGSSETSVTAASCKRRTWRAVRPAAHCVSLLPFAGSADLPQGHESRHLCSPQPQSLQRAPGFPAGQRRVPASAGHGVPDHPLRPWWPHLPRRRKRGQPLLRGVGVAGGHPGRRSGGHSRSGDYFLLWLNDSFKSRIIHF